MNPKSVQDWSSEIIRTIFGCLAVASTAEKRTPKQAAAANKYLTVENLPL
jgi:hypothetical protein